MGQILFVGADPLIGDEMKVLQRRIVDEGIDSYRAESKKSFLFILFVELIYFKGFRHRTLGKREKSASVEISSHPCSTASAAR